MGPTDKILTGYPSLTRSSNFRYFAHALTLRETVLFLRQNSSFKSSADEEGASADMCLGLDLIRCESLQSLDSSTASRLLNKNYS